MNIPEESFILTCLGLAEGFQAEKFPLEGNHTILSVYYGGRKMSIFDSRYSASLIDELGHWNDCIYPTVLSKTVEAINSYHTLKENLQIYTNAYCIWLRCRIDGKLVEERYYFKRNHDKCPQTYPVIGTIDDCRKKAIQFYFKNIN